MHARLEVAVAGKNRRGHDIVFGDGILDGRGRSGPELPIQVVQP